MDKPPDLSFLDLEEAVRQEWAALPVTRLLLDHLHRRQQLLRDDSLTCSSTGDYPRASACAGASLALAEIVSECTAARVRVEPAQDTTYVDPARRRIHA